MRRFRAMLLALALSCSVSAGALAANSEQTTSIPVTLTVIHSAENIDVTLPASLPVSVLDGKVITADNLLIQNNSRTTSVKVTNISVTDAAFKVASYWNFPANETRQIALRINGCDTRSAGSLALTDSAFPVIKAGASLPVKYDAKVSDSETVHSINAASVVITLKAA